MTSHPLHASVSLLEELVALRAERDRLRAQVEEVTRERDLIRTYQPVLEAERDEARRIAQGVDWMLAASLDREAAFRAALVAVGPLLPTCACGVAACVRCEALRLRREALGEPAQDVPQSSGR